MFSTWNSISLFFDSLSSPILVARVIHKGSLTPQESTYSNKYTPCPCVHSTPSPNYQHPSTPWALPPLLPPPELSTTNSFFWKEHFVTTRDTLLIYKWRQTRGKSNKCNSERNCFVLTLPVFSPFYIYSWKSQGSTIYIYKKGTTLLFSNCVPSLIYIYEAKYEPWGGIQIVSPHFVTLKDLFKGNVLYFCGNIVSRPRPNSVGT